MEQSWHPYLRVATLLCGDRTAPRNRYVRWQKVNRIGDPHAYLRRMLVNGEVSWWRRTRRTAPVAAGPETRPRRT